MFEGMGKNVSGLRVCFFEIRKYISEKFLKSAPEPSIYNYSRLDQNLLNTLHMTFSKHQSA